MGKVKSKNKQEKYKEHFSKIANVTSKGRTNKKHKRG